MKKISILLACLILFSCGNDYEEFCTYYHANFSCDITNVPFNAVNSMGQFITVRKKSVNMSCDVYNPSLNKTYSVPLAEVDARYAEFGLGGLIIGQPYFNDGTTFYAYDLACPQCDKAYTRLTINAQGTASCAKCGNVYDLNNSGFIIEGEGRPLYRYHVTQSSVNTIYVHN